MRPALLAVAVWLPLGFLATAVAAQDPARTPDTTEVADTPVMAEPAGTTGSARAQHFPASDDLRLLFRYMVEDGEAPGVALTLLDPDGSTRVVAYGRAGPDGSIGPGSAFELGHLTMPFTATLLVDMVARGEVSMDDPVAMYLPDTVDVPSLSGFEITLGHLVEHRSGLPAEPPAAYEDFTVDDLYAFLGRYELDWVPGRRHEVSVPGYGLLGHALARAAGMPFADLLRARVLEPLGMDGTGYAADIDPGARVRGHANGDAVAPTRVTEALQGGTGLLSTPRDMGAFLALNAQPPETALGAAVRVAQEIPAGDPEGEGRGFSWRANVTARQQLLIVHGGGTAGFTSFMAFDPSQGIGTVLLANTRGFRDWAARDLLFFAAPEVAPVEVDPAVLARYVGAYGGRGDRYRASLNRGSVYIRAADDHLTWQPQGDVRTPLFPTSDSTFYMLRVPLTVAFERVGDAMQMTAVIDGRESVGMGRTFTRWRVDAETPPPEVAAGNVAPWSAWPTGTWLLVGLVGVVAAFFMLRPLWSGGRTR